MNAWGSIGLVLLALGALMGGLKLFDNRLSPEVSRKTAHVVMGLICLSFPWLFSEMWPVVLLATLAVIGLSAVRCVSTLRTRMGSVLGGVERVSFGELYFPVAVAIVFFLSRGDKLLFCIPVLMLTLADAAGALIGSNYGRTRYSTADGTRKSWEGSLAFFSVAFLCAHVPILLFSTTGRAESLLIGILLAGLVMLAEAAAWRGLDNLFIPLAAHGLLKEYLGMDVSALGQRTLMLIVVLIPALWLKRRLTLNGGALALAIILCYFCGAVGGWNWLLAPLAVFIGYTIPFARKRRAVRNHSLEGVLCVASGALFWALVAQESGNTDLVFPFTVWLAANFAMITVSQTGFDFPQRTIWQLLLIATLWPAILCLVPFALLTTSTSPWVWVFVGIGMILIFLAALTFYRLEPNPRDARVTLPRWFLQGGIAAAFSALAWASLYIPFSVSS
ncbi:MAG: hypothetical protein LBV12_11245 [Puniceicoccales bacterium]|jgi:phytol kinase|nr:hypothetical protein [Puniceicoccales bacterium]